jgi:hypothetical protein
MSFSLNHAESSDLFVRPRPGEGTGWFSQISAEAVVAGRRTENLAKEVYSWVSQRPSSGQTLPSPVRMGRGAGERSRSHAQP